jgi:tetratricopeptide (TPR) repeat protein
MAVMLLGRVWWLRDHDSRIAFLDRRPPAEWIVFPKPPDGQVHPTVELSALFGYTFVLNGAPKEAKLNIRAFRHGTVTLNGAALQAAVSGADWKQPTVLEVGNALRAGTNVLTVNVLSSNGLPALWVELDAGGGQLLSDTDWDVSLMGSTWQKARLASEPVKFGPGNELSGAPAPGPSLLKHLPLFLGFAVLSAALCFGGRKWLERRVARGDAAGGMDSRRFAAAAVGVVAFLWLALFINNAGQMPASLGFDAKYHLEYIDYIKTRWRLPFADEGWAMFHPPLYYAICALLTAPIQAAGFSNASIAILRAFNMSLGLTHAALVLLSLRLLFPGRPGAQLFGFLLAAALPENIYISQYITNEPLCALLVSAAVYLCLRLLRDDRNSLALPLGVGACMGAALLTKFTALVAVPIVFGVLSAGVLRCGQRSARGWLTRVVVPFITTFAVCGWHYARVYRRFGTPLVGNWDTASGNAWWMENGYQTPGYFLRFGHCLAYPWYGGFWSFFDGLYSTLWGDGMWGGTPSLSVRPPWNYEIMAGSYLLALVPAIIVCAGAVVAVGRFLRQPRLDWAAVIGLAAATFAAMVYMALKVPCYAQIKSFYGLIALVPFCAFGALGWELIARRGRIAVTACAVAIGLWAIASYASFWIRSWSPETHVDLGLVQAVNRNGTEATREFAEALRLDPQNAQARWLLAHSTFTQNGVTETEREVDAVLQDAPDDAQCRLFSAVLLADQGRLSDAIAEGRRAIARALDLARPYQDVSGWLNTAGQFHEAAETAREGLRADPFDPQLHYQLAVALAAMTNSYDAITHYRDALAFNPNLPPALDGLAWILATDPNPAFRNGAEAVRLAGRACELTATGDSQYLGTLAAAYAEAGDFDRAVTTARQAVTAAQKQGATDSADRNQRRMELYLAHRPFHQDPARPAPP